MNIKELLSGTHTPIAEAIGKYEFSEDEYNSLKKGFLLDFNNISYEEEYFEAIKKYYIPEIELFNSICEKNIAHIWLCSLNKLEKLKSFCDTILHISMLNQNNWLLIQSKRSTLSYEDINKYVSISKAIADMVLISKELMEKFVNHLHIIKSVILNNPEDWSIENIIKMIHTYAFLIDELTLSSFDNEELKMYVETAENLLLIFKTLSENADYNNKEEVMRDIAKLKMTMIQVRLLTT
jgi:hypothetical protein